MENIRVVSEPRAGAGDADFVREGKTVRSSIPGSASATVTGTVAEWETWTGIASPESGRYVFTVAPRPVAIARDLGRYDEPNSWMRHPIC